MDIFILRISFLACFVISVFSGILQAWKWVTVRTLLIQNLIVHAALQLFFTSRVDSGTCRFVVILSGCTCTPCSHILAAHGRQALTQAGWQLLALSNKPLFLFQTRASPCEKCCQSVWWQIGHPVLQAGCGRWAPATALYVGCCSSSPTPTAVGAARGAWNLGPGRVDGLGCLKLVGFSFKSLCALVLQSVKWRDLWLSWRGAEEVWSAFLEALWSTRIKGAVWVQRACACLLSRILACTLQFLWEEVSKTPA